MDIALELSPQVISLIKLGYGVGGLLCLALAGVGFGQTVGNRVVNALIGVGCLSYAGYLLLSDPTTVWVSPYLLLLPVIVLFQTISNGVRARQRQDA